MYEKYNYDPFDLKTIRVTTDREVFIISRKIDDKPFIGKLLKFTKIEEFALNYDREFKSLNEL